MNVGFYQGAAAMSSLERWQNTIALNLSSASVSGFKRTATSFELSPNPLAQQPKLVALDPSAVNQVGMIEQTDFTAGSLNETKQPTDLAIGGEGFFKLKKPDGGFLYTRNGSFHLSPESQLVNSQGYLVMASGSPVTIDRTLGPVSVGSDGTVSQDGNPISKIDVISYEEPERLRQVPGGFMAPEGLMLAEKPVQDPQIRQGYLESSNTDTLREMVSLITVSRAYELNHRALNAYEQSLEQTVQHLATNR